MSLFNIYGNMPILDIFKLKVKTARAILAAFAALTGVNCLLAIVGIDFYIPCCAELPFIMTTLARAALTGGNAAKAILLTVGVTALIALYIIAWRVSLHRPKAIIASALLFVVDCGVIIARLGSANPINVLAHAVLLFVVIFGIKNTFIMLRLQKEHDNVEADIEREKIYYDHL